MILTASTTTSQILLCEFFLCLMSEDGSQPHCPWLLINPVEKNFLRLISRGFPDPSEVLGWPANEHTSNLQVTCHGIPTQAEVITTRNCRMPSNGFVSVGTAWRWSLASLTLFPIAVNKWDEVCTWKRILAWEIKSLYSLYFAIL